MAGEEEIEYAINLHVGGSFARDPDLRYYGGYTVRIQEDPDRISYFELEEIVKDKGFKSIKTMHYFVQDLSHLRMV